MVLQLKYHIGWWTHRFHPKHGRPFWEQVVKVNVGDMFPIMTNAGCSFFSALLHHKAGCTVRRRVGRAVGLARALRAVHEQPRCGVRRGENLVPGTPESSTVGERSPRASLPCQRKVNHVETGKKQTNKYPMSAQSLLLGDDFLRLLSSQLRP